MWDPARIRKSFAFTLNKRSNYDILDNWKNPHIGSLMCGMRAIMMERPREAIRTTSIQESNKPEARLNS